MICYATFDQNTRVIDGVFQTAVTVARPGVVEITAAQYHDPMTLGGTVDQDGAVTPAVPTAPAPIAVLSPRQIRLALNQLGLRAQVEAAVTAAGGDLADWWEYSLEYRRDHPLVEQMLTALGMPPAQADAIWALGATL